MRFIFLVAVCLCSALPVKGMYLYPSERIVFIGDSITAAGHYTAYVEAFLRVRFPNRDYVVINEGRGSETVSGRTEADHPGPRPNINDRIAGVLDLNPTLVSICYGMNDGNYLPLNTELSAYFVDGYDRLVSRIKRDSRARVLMLTSPPYDHVGRMPASDVRPVGTYGYKRPFAYYDSVLSVFSDHLIKAYGRDYLVVDLHSRMNERMSSVQRADADFRFQDDGIHPDTTGHLVMAMTILERWDAFGWSNKAVLDDRLKKGVSPSVSNATFNRVTGGIEFDWASLLPMPTESSWDNRVLELERFQQRLNPMSLQVHMVGNRRFALTIDGASMGEVDTLELQKGLDLTGRTEMPIFAVAGRVLPLIYKQRQLGNDHWRALNSPEHKEWMDLDDQIRTLCQPRNMKVRLVPVVKAAEVK